MDENQSVKLLRSFEAAWNAHDCEALLAHVTEDCIFDSSAGPTAFGARHLGRPMLAKAFAAIWEVLPDARWEDATHVACGDRGFSEWTFRGTRADGVAVEARGVDLFRFRGNLICHKDTFRKTIIA